MSVLSIARPRVLATLSFSETRRLDDSMDERDSHQVGQVLRRLGVKQNELARRIGITPTQVNRLINGQRRMTLEWLRTFADALDIKASDFLPDQDFENRLSKDEAKLLDNYRMLNTQDQIKLNQISSVMTGQVPDDTIFKP